MKLKLLDILKAIPAKLAARSISKGPGGEFAAHLLKAGKSAEPPMLTSQTSNNNQPPVSKPAVSLWERHSTPQGERQDNLKLASNSTNEASRGSTVQAPTIPSPEPAQNNIRPQSKSNTRNASKTVQQTSTVAVEERETTSVKTIEQSEAKGAEVKRVTAETPAREAASTVVEQPTVIGRSDRTDRPLFERQARRATTLEHSLGVSSPFAMLASASQRSEYTRSKIERSSRATTVTPTQAQVVNEEHAQVISRLSPEHASAKTHEPAMNDNRSAIRSQVMGRAAPAVVRDAAPLNPVAVEPVRDARAGSNNAKVRAESKAALSSGESKLASNKPSGTPRFHSAIRTSAPVKREGDQQRIASDTKTTTTEIRSGSDLKGEGEVLRNSSAPTQQEMTSQARGHSDVSSSAPMRRPNSITSVARGSSNDQPRSTPSATQQSIHDVKSEQGRASTNESTVRKVLPQQTGAAQRAINSPATAASTKDVSRAGESVHSGKQLQVDAPQRYATQTSAPSTPQSVSIASAIRSNGAVGHVAIALNSKSASKREPTTMAENVTSRNMISGETREVERLDVNEKGPGQSTEDRRDLRVELLREASVAQSARRFVAEGRNVVASEKTANSLLTTPLAEMADSRTADALAAPSRQTSYDSRAHNVGRETPKLTTEVYSAPQGATTVVSEKKASAVVSKSAGEKVAPRERPRFAATSQARREASETMQQSRETQTSVDSKPVATEKKTLHTASRSTSEDPKLTTVHNERKPERQPATSSAPRVVLPEPVSEVAVRQTVAKPVTAAGSGQLAATTKIELPAVTGGNSESAVEILSQEKRVRMSPPPQARSFHSILSPTTTNARPSETVKLRPREAPEDLRSQSPRASATRDDRASVQDEQKVTERPLKEEAEPRSGRPSVTRDDRASGQVEQKVAERPLKADVRSTFPERQSRSELPSTHAARLATIADPQKKSSSVRSITKRAEPTVSKAQPARDPSPQPASNVETLALRMPTPENMREQVLQTAAHISPKPEKQPRTRVADREVVNSQAPIMESASKATLAVPPAEQPATKPRTDETSPVKPVGREFPMITKNTWASVADVVQAAPVPLTTRNAAPAGSQIRFDVAAPELRRIGRGESLRVEPTTESRDAQRSAPQESPVARAAEPSTPRDAAPESGPMRAQEMLAEQGARTQFETARWTPDARSSATQHAEANDALKAALKQALEQSRKRLVEPDELRLTLPFGELGTLEIDVLRENELFAIRIAADPIVAAVMEEQRLQLAYWLRDQGFPIQQLEIAERPSGTTRQSSDEMSRSREDSEHPEQGSRRETTGRSGRDLTGETVAARPMFSGARVWTA